MEDLMKLKSLNIHISKSSLSTVSIDDNEKNSDDNDVINDLKGLKNQSASSFYTLSTKSSSSSFSSLSSFSSTKSSSTTTTNIISPKASNGFKRVLCKELNFYQSKHLYTINDEINNHDKCDIEKDNDVTNDVIDIDHDMCECDYDDSCESCSILKINPTPANSPVQTIGRI